jgi:hypothetical protein
MIVSPGKLFISKHIQRPGELFVVSLCDFRSGRIKYSPTTNFLNLKEQVCIWLERFRENE